MIAHSPRSETQPPRLRQPEPCRCPLCRGAGELEPAHALNILGAPETCPACKGKGRVLPPREVELTWRCGHSTWMPWGQVELPVLSLAHAQETPCAACVQAAREVTRCAA